MTAWTGKSKGGALGYRFFLWLIRVSPLPVVYFFMRLVVVWYFLFSAKSASWFYFRRIHGYGLLRAWWSIYLNFCQLGESLIDRVALLSGKKTGFSFTYEGEEHLHAMREGGRGGILIGAHMGNWEVAGQLLERIDTVVNIVMLEAERANIDRLMKGAMVERRLRVISQKDDYTHLFAIREALQRHEFVVLHGDRFLPGARNMPISFLGREARFPTGPLYLAGKYGVPVSYVFTLKEGRGYHFFATAPKIYSHPAHLSERAEAMRGMLGDYVEALETIVRRYPLQWFNFYPFWEEEQKTKSA